MEKDGFFHNIELNKSMEIHSISDKKQSKFNAFKLT